MVIPVDVVAALILCANVHTTQKVILVIAVCHSTMTSHGGMEKQIMHIHAGCVTATAMLPRVTIILQWIHSQTVMIREEEESVTIAKAILVSENSCLN